MLLRIKTTAHCSLFGYGESNPELPRFVKFQRMRGGNVSRYTIPDLYKIAGGTLIGMMSVDVLTLINRFYGPGVNEAKNVRFDVLCCGSDCSGSNCTAIQQSLFARTTIVVVTAGHRQLQIIIYALAVISHFITTSILDYL